MGKQEAELVPARVLALLLRLIGLVMLPAFVAVFLPTAWMARTHSALGLGDFPATPVVDYLTRSISALYGFHGGLLLVVSGNVERYRGVVAYVATMHLLFGVAMLAIDLHAGMPWLWTVAEGPPIVAAALIMLYLLRSIPRN